MPSTRFTYHHPRADLHFDWDGGTQIQIRTGRTVPSWGVVPGRFSICEPDLWQSDLLPEDERPTYKEGYGVVLLPPTQEAFEQACNAWWEGRYVKTARDFTRHPFTGSGGHIGSVFDYRYTGGPSIEACAAGAGAWRPVVDLADDGMDPADVTAEWLSERIHGWEVGVLELLGVVKPPAVADPSRYGWDTHDEIAAWTCSALPDEVAADCVMAAWRTWLERTVRSTWASGAQSWRGAGRLVRHVSDYSPWTYEATGADGTRFNFIWCGLPWSHVCNRDAAGYAGLADCDFILFPAEAADGPVLPWLQRQADAWIAAYDTGPDALGAWQRRIDNDARWRP